MSFTIWEGIPRLAEINWYRGQKHYKIKYKDPEKIKNTETWKSGKEKNDYLHFCSLNVRWLYGSETLTFDGHFWPISEGNNVDSRKIWARQGCAIHYSCHPEEHKLGNRFIVSNRIKWPDIDLQLLNELHIIYYIFCKLRIEEKFFNYLIIRIHAQCRKRMIQRKNALWCEDSNELL